MTEKELCPICGETYTKPNLITNLTEHNGKIVHVECAINSEFYENDESSYEIID